MRQLAYFSTTGGRYFSIIEFPLPDRICRSSPLGRKVAAGKDLMRRSEASLPLARSEAVVQKLNVDLQTIVFANGLRSVAA
ncbi:hypothetical protein KSP40_PGU022528 [Platanthera guangdongensis]|uniref:Uncharacterized protein n=1 Tax=Platanthera guangdongensis TaxID=2320717 RepID=A0ABR2LFH9_9ASPA